MTKRISNYMIKSKDELVGIVQDIREPLSLYKTNIIEEAEIEILDKVNLMTPENIHMNAFMYEPLIDISLHHLKELYNNVCLLN